MGWALLVGGVVMWIVDAMKAPWEKAGPGASGSPIKTWKMEDMSLGQSIWVGACQILSAVFPGTSRSMATIAGGQLAGMSRASALEFSFFLSMPTMVVATGYTLLKSVMGKGVENPIGVSQLTGEQWGVLALGFVVSFVVAYAAVAWFMAWVRQRGFVPFAVYRIVVGLPFCCGSPEAVVVVFLCAVSGQQRLDAPQRTRILPTGWGIPSRYGVPIPAYSTAGGVA